MSHFVVLNFVAHFAFCGITSLFISVNSYIFLTLLTSFLRREKKSLPDTFQKEAIQQKLLCFLGFLD